MSFVTFSSNFEIIKVKQITDTPMQKYHKKTLIISLLTIILTATAEIGPQQCPAIVVPCIQKQQNNQQNDKPTIISFYVQLDEEQSKDYIQLSLTVKQKDESLKKAVDKVTKKSQAVRNSFMNYCQKHQGKDCDTRVQIDNFDVEPSYQIIRREPNFNGFVVTNDIKIVVKQTQNIGDLVDSLLQLQIYQINQLEWKPEIELDVMEKAVDQGITKGKQLCKHINRQMGTILSIQQVYFEQDQEQDKQQEDGGNEEDQQEQEQFAVLQFKIQCIDKFENSQKTSTPSNRKKLQIQQNDKKKKKK